MAASAAIALIDRKVALSTPQCAKCKANIVNKNKPGTNNDKYIECTKCKAVKYCCLQCMSSHHSTHAKECKGRAGLQRLRDIPWRAWNAVCLEMTGGVNIYITYSKVSHNPGIDDIMERAWGDPAFRVVRHRYATHNNSLKCNFIENLSKGVQMSIFQLAREASKVNPDAFPDGKPAKCNPTSTSGGMNEVECVCALHICTPLQYDLIPKAFTLVPTNTPTESAVPKETIVQLPNGGQFMVLYTICENDIDKFPPFMELQLANDRKVLWVTCREPDDTKQQTSKQWWSNYLRSGNSFDKKGRMFILSQMRNFKPFEMSAKYRNSVDGKNDPELENTCEKMDYSEYLRWPRKFPLREARISDIVLGATESLTPLPPSTHDEELAQALHLTSITPHPNNNNTAASATAAAAAAVVHVDTTKSDEICNCAKCKAERVSTAAAAAHPHIDSLD